MSTSILVTMLVLFALSVPIAVSIGLAGVVGIAGFTNLPLLLVAQQLFVSLDRYPLAAIPFFILAGNLMEVGGISTRLVDFAKSIVGGIQGGLACTCVLTCMIFAAVSGSSVATTFAIGAILIPAMVRHGYPAPFAAALQATSAELGVIIPPSIPMILYAVSAEVSIGELFIAGIGPGILIAAALTLFVYVWCRIKGLGKNDREGQHKVHRRFEKIGAGPADAGRHHRRHLWRRLHPDRSLRRRCFLRASGRHGDLPRNPARPTCSHILRKSVISSAIIMFIIANAGLFSFLINRAGVPVAVGEWLVQTIETGAGFLLAVNVFLFVLGMFVETSAAIIVLAPILAPVASHFGIDPIHFGLIMVVNLAMGMITPPFGVNLFAACQVARIPLDRIVAPLVPFVLVILTCLMIVTYVPEVSLLFRDLLY